MFEHINDTEFSNIDIDYTSFWSSIDSIKERIPTAHNFQVEDGDETPPMTVSFSFGDRKIWYGQSTQLDAI